jgi:hypothetical protein
MAQTFQEIKTLLANMSFTPDVPSSALGPTEYNIGQNVETDTRGIRSVFGDQEILDSIPGAAGPAGITTFVTGGYRDDENWNYIVCVLSNTNQGRWYAVKTSGIQNITPGFGADPNAFLPGYGLDTAITATWNGTILIVNDSVNVPMFLTGNSSEFQQYSQTSTALVTTATAGNGAIATITFATQATAPFNTGDVVVVYGVTPSGYNGTYTVITGTTSTITYASAATGSQTVAGEIVPQYQWNYTPGWNKVTAGFLRMYSTPNVGSILIAGNLTAELSNNTVENFPVTVQWSQSFGLNGVPLTWAPTVDNIANQLEVPVRGPVIDGFPANGNFYVCSYWDTVVFSPISYQGTNYPVLGVKLLNQGRGLLNENCWANADQVVYGLDARDIWVFDGNAFKSLGNQRVKNYFYANLNPLYSQRTFVINNTEKNQIEIYYADLTSTGWPNKILSYRYDLNCWNAPRDVSEASSAIEGPLYESGVYNKATRTVTYSRAVQNSLLVEKDQGTSFIGGTAIESEFQRDNISLGLKYSQHALVHRVLPEVVNIDTAGLPLAGNTATAGTVTVAIGGSNSVGQETTFKPATTLNIATSDPWIQANQNAYRIYGINVSNSSTTKTWQCTGVSWQFTPTEDDR